MIMKQAEFYISKDSAVGNSLQEYRKFTITKFLIRAYQICGFRINQNDTFKSIPKKLSVDDGNEHCIKIREFTLGGDTDYFRHDVRIGPVDFKEHGSGADEITLEAKIYRLYKSVKI